MASRTVHGLRKEPGREAQQNPARILKTSASMPGAVPAGAGRAAIEVTIDPGRDALLTNFGRATLQDRYLLAGETPQDLFARVARAYGDDAAHAQRLYDYMSRLWFLRDVRYSWPQRRCGRTFCPRLGFLRERR
jgi:hypothetical protein